jgi:hypothetical protein
MQTCRQTDRQTDTGSQVVSVSFFAETRGPAQCSRGLGTETNGTQVPYVACRIGALDPKTTPVWRGPFLDSVPAVKDSNET